MKTNDFDVFGARIWRPESDVLEPLSSILRVRDGSLAAVDPAVPDEPAPTSAPEVGLRSVPGRVVVPGLIDGHVHLELDPALRTPRDQLKVPEAVRRRSMAARAAEMLAAGITTARDCGGGRHFEHALRRCLDDGDALGPRLLCCGQPLTSIGGHCHFWGGEVRTLEEIDRVVARQIEAGSDWIKVMATGGLFTPGSRATAPQFDYPTMCAIVEAAAKEGRSVAAHCHATEGIANAVRAGVRTIEHASFAGPEGFGTALDASLMREMGERDLWVSPTVNAGWGGRIEDEAGAPTDFFRRHSRSLRTQRDHGIRFIASTDAGIPGVAHQDLVGGLLAFQRFADLRPVDVLRAATSEAAAALGLDQETGRLEAGLSADFLVLDANPLDDLSALRDPEVVVFRGAWLDRETRRLLVAEARQAVEAVSRRRRFARWSVR